MTKELDITGGAAILKAVSNPARLRIALCLLGGERSVSELESELGLRQPNLSQHLADLRNINLVTTRREFKSVYYRLSDENSKRFITGLLYSLGGTAANPLKEETQTSQLSSVRRHRPHQAAVFAKLDPRLKELA
jgi:DNA-binding transcriptional ArsR family regulator